MNERNLLSPAPGLLLAREHGLKYSSHRQAIQIKQNFKQHRGLLRESAFQDV